MDSNDTIKIVPVTFSMALQWLKDGKRCARANWNAKGQWLKLQRPDDHSLMSLPYIYIKTVQGDFVPWLASQSDLLADDWFLVGEF